MVSIYKKFLILNNLIFFCNYFSKYDVLLNRIKIKEYNVMFINLQY